MGLTCHPSPAARDQVRHWPCLHEPHACGPSLDSVCSCFPPCFLKCVAAAWPSQASSSRTRSTSAPRTTSNSMGPAATAAGTSSRARSSQPWAAPTTPSASCAACAGEPAASGGRILCLHPQGRGEVVFPRQFWGIQGFMLDTWISRISGAEGSNGPVVFKPLNS